MKAPITWMIENAATGDEDELSDREIWDIMRNHMPALQLEPWERQEAATQQGWLLFLQELETGTGTPMNPPEETPADAERKQRERRSQPRPWPRTWDRGHVLAAIEDATGQVLQNQNPLPDTLIAKAQELGMMPAELSLWIAEKPEHGWTPGDLASWARRNGIGRQPPAKLLEDARCLHCGRPAADPDNHQC
jgi:hypothetical protein